MTKAQYEKLQRATVIMGKLDKFVEALPRAQELLEAAESTILIEKEERDLDCETLLGWNRILEYVKLVPAALDRYYTSTNEIIEIVESIDHYIGLIIAHDEMENNLWVQKYRESLKQLS